VAVPEPMGTLAQPEGQINILLMGSDQRPNDGGFRTDVNLLLTLNFEGQSVSLTSFPRDLYVYQPGWRVDRINGAQVRGGFELSAQTIEYNFGVRPDHYVLVNFQGFINIIDALGGITVNVGQALTDEREGPGDFSVPAGNVTMDGETALWYVRSRGTSSDFERTRRQQEVLVGIFFRLLSLDAITRAPELYEQYKQTVVTDLGIGDILPWLPLAATVNGNGQIHRYAIGAGQVDSFTTSSGGAVLLPKRDDVKTIMKQALSSPE
ncbi:MAG: LCP family protein, partial [Anaerolineales bacterium]